MMVSTVVSLSSIFISAVEEEVKGEDLTPFSALRGFDCAHLL
jgi:hypothetical protein